MTLFSQLRALVLLRRIARALERIAESQEQVAVIAESDWEHRNVRPRPKPIEVGTLDLAESNKRWQQQRAERMEEEA